MSTLLLHLQLRPHYDRLLTSSAAFWLFSARLLVCAMACSEAVAWGYLGFLFGEGDARWLVAVFTGTIIFVVVWLIDSSLITLDSAWGEHSRTILGREGGSAPARKARQVFTFAIRIGLLMMSLMITSPYLAQLVFYKDIQSYLASEANQAIEGSRRALNAKHDRLISEKNQELQAKRVGYEKEVAGKGLSGRYGEGPAAHALSESASKLEEDLGALLNDKESALSAFDALAQNWETNRDKLTAQYNLSLPSPSILENRRALEVLRARPENKSTEWAIRAFLLFIFVGLLLLKLFEPSSVRLYFSEALQQEYGRYLAGSFDSMLPVTERSTTNHSAMSPQRFYDFLVRVWVPARRLEEQQAESRARTAAATQSLDVLESMSGKIDHELSLMKGEVQTTCSTADEANKSLTELNSAIAAVNNDIESFQADLAALENSNPTLDVRSRLEYRSYLTGELARAERALADLKEALPGETERFRRANDALQFVEGRLKDKEAELAEAQKRIRDVREMLTRSVDTKARSILDPATGLT